MKNIIAVFYFLLITTSAQAGDIKITSDCQPVKGGVETNLKCFDLTLHVSNLIITLLSQVPSTEKIDLDWRIVVSEATTEPRKVLITITEGITFTKVIGPVLLKLDKPDELEEYREIMRNLAGETLVIIRGHELLEFLRKSEENP
ncbi:MAG: hypothetical protein COT91_03415 [Candidatus Doudnabacteria bacterium CG10_big_fil_rev_8_21_14_0_10_41_10]|uniref:CHRD domain-containing protein n=1 Tax=Candidatus Doudnabacteria bacterium CG10_big_fil_rev_8_21_14_0_10_41_10 TaxID=1974551 RepID=A0A2H0VFH7_9BACT|nr:MAG: hypothetical protein COT91_03415 [Candidatus Doudnabacteria bacterium CG10_big_fil_rev_8_21_14_0_10_41_10]